MAYGHPIGTGIETGIGTQKSEPRNAFFSFLYFPSNPETEIRIYGYRWNPWVKPDPQVPCRRL